MAKGETRYSEKVAGNAGNYNKAVRFDETDGYIGITQWDGGAMDPDSERVLLSAAQFHELVRFRKDKAP